MVINGSGTITGLTAGGLPDATITQADLATGVAGTGPAFSAYLSATQSYSSSTWTKATFDTEEFDTNSNFASSRFTPTVAGYYQINATTFQYPSSGTSTVFSVQIYKNGTGVKGSRSDVTSVQNGISVFGLLYMNGTTDYVEIYVYTNGTSPSLAPAVYNTYFFGSMARGA
jgi:hypothetical protein